MESVLDTVGKVEGAWQAKRKAGVRGSVNSRFHKFCGTLDAHSSLLKVLPEGSHYVSLFSGSLNAVIAVVPILLVPRIGRQKTNSESRPV